MPPYTPPKEAFMVRVNAQQGISPLGNWTDDNLIIDGTTYPVSPWVATELDILTRTGKLTFERGLNKKEVWLNKGDGAWVIINELDFVLVRMVNLTASIQTRQNK